MKKVLRTVIVALVVVAAVAAVWWHFYSRSWPDCFQKELDAFFGEGNWQVVSQEEKESIIFSVHHYSSLDDLTPTPDTPGKFHNWDIAYTSPDGETSLWRITDHALKINHDKYSWFSGKQLSTRQALTQQLMFIVTDMAAEQVYEDVIAQVFPEEQAECIQVDLTYRGGNPRPGVYNRLVQQDWFTAQNVTVRDILGTDLHDFYIFIRAFDYRVAKLPEEEQQDLWDRLGELEQALKAAYGPGCKYEIFLGNEYRAENP